MRDIRRGMMLAAVMIWLTVAQEAFAGGVLVLDESAYFRQWLSFGVPRYSPALLKSDGEKVLAKAGIERLKRDTERLMQQQGKDPGAADWRANVYQPVFVNFVASGTTSPAGAWAKGDFDDSSWLRKRGPFQGSAPTDITNPDLGQYDEGMDMGLLHAYYRARFVVSDSAKADLSLKIAYHGGMRVLVNGQEIAREHLPKGQLDADVRAQDYPQEAYPPAGEALRLRSCGPVAVPAAALHNGVNVIAIEVHASDYHPVVLTNPRQANWGGPTRPFPHAQLCTLELRGAAGAVDSSIARGTGPQVWAADIHDVIHSNDFLPPGEDVGAIRMFGARNGTYSAQLAIGCDKTMEEVQVLISELKGEGNNVLPASAIRVMGMTAFPAEQWKMKYLGDERGLGANFPDAKALEGFDSQTGAFKNWMFDRIVQTAPRSLPAGTSAFWISLGIPAQTAPGKYTGTASVSAKGMKAVEIPVELTVAAWTLPAPKDFQTLVGCEENPYAVAKHYGLKPWSDEHFAMIETSLAQLGRVGNKWINVPVLVQTEYGNRDDSMIGWTRKKDGKWEFDYSVMDRYLDLHVKHCGRPRIVNFVVMHGMKDQLGRIRYADEGTDKTQYIDMTIGKADATDAWTSFAKSLAAHMKEKGLADAMYWGHPLESEADTELKNVLLAATPAVAWIAGPHEMMYNGTFAKNEKFYKVVETIRYWGDWPSFRMDEGWRSKTIHLLNPRVGGTVFALHTTSNPFAYRMLPDHALAFGRCGFTRVGADEWDAVHYDGMTIAKWQTGVPVLFLLWPGKGGAQSSARFECLLEGVQETEARIFIEQALLKGSLPAALAGKARDVLKDNISETMFVLGNSTIKAFEEYHYRWQERSAKLYQTAADVAEAMKK